MPSDKINANENGNNIEYTEKEFCKRFNFTGEHIPKCAFTWDDLVYIANDYNNRRITIINNEKSLVNLFQEAMRDKVSGIHSIRSRTKDTAHLIEKLIRKTTPEEKGSNIEKYEGINKGNYYKFVTDLAGIRLLMLYQKDWELIHKFITDVFQNDKNNYINNYLNDYNDDKEKKYIAEMPKGYICKGDINIYPKKLIKAEIGDRYRSIHYIIKYKTYYAEIQIRTIFQEGWSEIDHNILYPYEIKNKLFEIYSTVFSKITNVADEMGKSFFDLKEEYNKHKLIKEGDDKYIPFIIDSDNKKSKTIQTTPEINKIINDDKY